MSQFPRSSGLSWSVIRATEARKLVREWTTADLQPALAKVGKGRDFARGTQHLPDRLAREQPAPPHTRSWQLAGASQPLPCRKT